MKLKHIAAIATGIITALATSGYWYIFVAGAPPLDLPTAEAHTDLNFRVESFNSRAMGQVRLYGLVLPPGYAQHPKQRYPVIILLHGGHGDEQDYERKADLTGVLHDLYQHHQLPPTIVVTPDGNDWRGSSPFWDSNYYDGQNGNVGTLIGQELVQVLKSRYRTLNDGQFWAMGGLSSGGWGALNIGLRQWSQFNTLFSHTGYFTDKDGGAANSPQAFVSQLPIQARQRLHIYLDAGANDHQYLNSTQQFHQLLDRLHIANVFHTFPGGHGLYGPDSGWNYWHKHLKHSLSYVGEQFYRGFAARDRTTRASISDSTTRYAWR